jgi:carbon storage regulator
MLVLARRKDQSILIGDDIVIRVLDIDRNGQVKLGIEAPRSCRILREELAAQIQAENQQALAGKDAVLPDLGELAKPDAAPN